MTKITNIGEKGVSLIKKYEGFRARPYMCPARVPTIGYGATYYPGGKRVKLSDAAISENEAEQILREHISAYQAAVRRYVTSDINQNQFDALVSFAFNLGASALRRSTLLKRVNQNPNDPNIAYQFKRWVRANGRVLRGLQRRRAEEAKLYFS